MSPPLETSDFHKAKEPSAQHQNPFQVEADALRPKLSPRAGKALNDFIDGLDGVLTQVPDWTANVTGILLGVLARGPGAVGAIGKCAALPFGSAYLGDLGLRLTGLSNHSAAENQRAYQRDVIALGSIGAGFMLGGIIPKCRPFASLSKSSQFETKSNIIQFPLKHATELKGLPNPGNRSFKLVDCSENLASKTTGHMSHSDEILSSAKIKGLDNDNLIHLNRRAATFNCKETRMITDEDIAKFGQAKQEEIRKEMEQLIKSGRPKEFLDLWPDGSVTYNSQAHQDAILLGLCD
jgi:hypothetical protein